MDTAKMEEPAPEIEEGVVDAGTAAAADDKVVERKPKS